MVRYVHLPGGAVDTALLEDGRFPYLRSVFCRYAKLIIATRREAAQQAQKTK